MKDQPIQKTRPLPATKTVPDDLQVVKDERAQVPDSYYDNHVSAAVAELNYRGINMMQVPKAKRHEAFLLEEQLTQAANQGKDKLFLKLLREWRECFH